MITYEEYLTMADLADNMLYWDLMSAYEPYISSLSDHEESDLSGQNVAAKADQYRSLVTNTLT